MVSRSSVSWCLPFTATALPLACLVAIGSLSSPAAEPSSPSVVVRPAAELRLPSDTKLHAIDSNMPAHWDGDTLFVFTSGGGIPKPLPAARGETDKLAGRVARLFVHGRSNEEIVFLRPGESAGLP